MDRMKNKPFITANVRKITDAWLREDISYSRMVEMLNDISFQFFEEGVYHCLESFAYKYGITINDSDVDKWIKNREL
jgi:hypothetical protein